jgi:multisubunit Na+/H+ antiporter MnhG subunit
LPFWQLHWAAALTFESWTMEFTRSLIIVVAIRCFVWVVADVWPLKLSMTQLFLLLLLFVCVSRMVRAVYRRNYRDATIDKVTNP